MYLKVLKEKPSGWHLNRQKARDSIGLRGLFAILLAAIKQKRKFPKEIVQLSVQNLNTLTLVFNF